MFQLLYVQFLFEYCFFITSSVKKGCFPFHGLQASWCFMVEKWLTASDSNIYHSFCLNDQKLNVLWMIYLIFVSICYEFCVLEINIIVYLRDDSDFAPCFQTWRQVCSNIYLCAWKAAIRQEYLCLIGLLSSSVAFCNVAAVCMFISRKAMLSFAVLGRNCECKTLPGKWILTNPILVFQGSKTTTQPCDNCKAS